MHKEDQDQTRGDRFGPKFWAEHSIGGVITSTGEMLLASDRSAMVYLRALHEAGHRVWEYGTSDGMYIPHNVASTILNFVDGRDRVFWEYLVDSQVGNGYTADFMAESALKIARLVAGERNYDLVEQITYRTNVPRDEINRVAKESVVQMEPTLYLATLSREMANEVFARWFERVGVYIVLNSAQFLKIQLPGDLFTYYLGDQIYLAADRRARELFMGNVVPPTLGEMKKEK